MTIDELKADILSKAKFERYPKYENKGGQSVGMPVFGCTLYSEMTGFRVSIIEYKSQLKNKELATLLFQLYLDETIK